MFFVVNMNPSSFQVARTIFWYLIYFWAVVLKYRTYQFYFQNRPCKTDFTAWDACTSNLNQCQQPFWNSKQWSSIKWRVVSILVIRAISYSNHVRRRKWCNNNVAWHQKFWKQWSWRQENNHNIQIYPTWVAHKHSLSLNLSNLTIKSTTQQW